MKLLIMLLVLTTYSCSTPKKEKEHRLIDIKVTGLEDKWYQCKMDSECTLIQEKECGHYLSINRKYRKDVLDFIKEKGLPFACKKKWRLRPESFCDPVSDTCKVDDGKRIY